MPASRIILMSLGGILLLYFHIAFFYMGMDMMNWKSRSWPMYFIMPLMIDALILSGWLAAHGK